MKNLVNFFKFIYPLPGVMGSILYEQQTARHLFWYGFNSPAQISKLLRIPVEKIIARCTPWKLNGYRRGFARTDQNFEFPSAANIIKDKNSSIDSFALKVEPETIAHIDKFEEYPKEYDRIKIELESIHTNIFHAEAYVMTEKDTFEYPPDEYLHGVALTMATHNYLANKQADYENVSIEIYDYINDKTHGHHQVKLSLEDYPECVRNKVLLSSFNWKYKYWA